MKKILMALATVVVVALAMGCSSSTPVQGPTFGSAPWKDGDQALYDIVDRSGAKIGNVQISFVRDGNAWVITEIDQATDFDQTIIMRIDASTGKPLGEDQTIKAPGNDVTINTTYLDNKLDIKAVVNGENRTASIDVPANGFDNDQLLMTLRALPFNDNYQTKLVTVVARSAAMVDTTITVKGKETITVPAGTFNTWHVELDFGQTKQNVWYQVDAPNHMIQYDNGANNTVLTKG